MRRDTGGTFRMMRRWLLRIALAAVALFALAQVVPYGRNHSNPPVRAEPRWDSPRTRTLAVGACFDCHSNLTKWPWYSKVAPGSWLMQSDVDGGRAALNFSEWNRPQDAKGDIVEAVRGGGMPPWFYKPLHPQARLTAQETDQLVQGLIRTLRR